MSLHMAALASGSNGNCYYIGNDNEAVLVDVGISARELERRMKRLDLSPTLIKAVFVSHEHSDHICGLQTFSRKHRISVYITPATLRNSRLYLDKPLINSFSAFEPVRIGALHITAFPKFHDAIDPYSFVVRQGEVKVGVFTDIGLPCQHVTSYFSQCHAAFLESNYDEQMLMNGSYPFYLKRRISSDRGHLSNRQALELFRSYRPPHMSHLFLSHLSGNNNCPILVKDCFASHAGDVQLIVASRQEETAVYTITGTPAQPDNKRVQAAQLQMEF